MPYKDKEAKNANAREWRAKNRDRLRERARAHYALNKDALNERAAEWRRNNPEKHREVSARYYRRNRESIKAKAVENKAFVKRRNFISKYGITPREVGQLILIQGGRCAMCSRPFEGRHNDKLAPVVDHCHRTDQVRGILHNICNRAIGMLGDDFFAVQTAANYLKRAEGL